MIDINDAEKAAEFMRDNADKFARAKAEFSYLHEFRKSKKAELMNSYKTPIGAKATDKQRESYAYAHPEYLQLLEGYREAIREMEYLRWMLKAAEVKVEMWRTESANNRMVERAHR